MRTQQYAESARSIGAAMSHLGPTASKIASRGTSANPAKRGKPTKQDHRQNSAIAARNLGRSSCKRESAGSVTACIAPTVAYSHVRGSLPASEYAPTATAPKAEPTKPVSERPA